mgnify:FL=1|jgi:hypothetical protein|tara:strand:- start:1881 stop:2726 length:846 start_codon:yes stop_codon:yes gene_type:complete
MSSVKHSKIKNTGILFELLVRQIASDTLASDNSQAVRIIKEYFSHKTQLGKELLLYQTILKEKFDSEPKANRFIDAVISSRQKLNKSKLRREKYNLIKEIKQHYDLQKLTKARVDNYRTLASTYSIFENTAVTPADGVKLRYNLVEAVTGKQANKSVKKQIVSEYQQQDKDMQLLSYQILVDKFNEKYGDLSTKQKNVLREYINNVSNTSNLKELISTEVPHIKRTLRNKIRSMKDPVMRIKLKEVAKQATALGRRNVIKDQEVLSLMRFYELIKELKNIK